MDIIKQLLSYEFGLYNWQKRMEETEQNPEYHGEGNVLKHTTLVLEELLKQEDFQKLEETDKRNLLLATLLHDIAKPFCTVAENGKISSPGHAVKGGMEARRLIYKYGFMEEIFGKIDFKSRETICSLIRYHGLPLFFYQKNNVEKEIYKASLEVDLNQLSILATADIKGRICQDKDKLLDNVELFRETCRENECFGQPKEFLSPRSRFYYFKYGEQYLHYDPYESEGSTVYLLSGIPASGKDTYIKEYLGQYDMVSLDEIRRELNIKPTDKQGRVIQEAKARAKKYLAQKKDFVWNATNLSLSLRTPLIDLVLQYGGEVKLIYKEVPFEIAQKRNSERQHVVPEVAMNRMADNLEVPRLWEAEEVEYHVEE